MSKWFRPGCSGSGALLAGGILYIACMSVAFSSLRIMALFDTVIQKSGGAIEIMLQKSEAAVKSLLGIEFLRFASQLS